MTDSVRRRARGAGPRATSGRQTSRPIGLEDPPRPALVDVVVPIVFPDYDVRFDLGEVRPRRIKTPLGNVTTPSIDLDLGKWPVGHAGVLLIKNTGLTKYYEYGRYDNQRRGLVKKRAIPNARMGSDGRPTRDALTTVLHFISQTAGHEGRIEAAYIEVPGKFDVMHRYAERQKEDTESRTRKAYDPTNNSCLHFMKEVIEVAGPRLPEAVDPRPDSYIDEIQDTYPDLTYEPTSGTLNLKYREAELERTPVPSWAGKKSFWEGLGDWW